MMEEALFEKGMEKLQLSKDNLIAAFMDDLESSCGEPPTDAQKVRILTEVVFLLEQGKKDFLKKAKV